MTDLEDKAVWKPCFSMDGVELPTGYYFGFSAATGDLSDNHEVLAVRLYEVDSDDPVKLFHYHNSFNINFYILFGVYKIKQFFRMKL